MKYEGGRYDMQICQCRCANESGSRSVFFPGAGGVGGYLHESDILRFCVEQVCGATEVKFAWDGYEVRDGDRRNGVHVGSW
jgi:hypothetical protein